MNNLDLKAIEDIQNMSFYIPNYQRGYRWTSIQVKDLLDDIAEFYISGAEGIYCVQPLVVVERKGEELLKQIKEANDINAVKKLLSGKWEVVDGQQRLTTIKLILQVLNLPSYTLEYETRKGSEKYIEQIGDEYESNIDFYHMWNAKDTIQKWFEDHSNLNRAEFENVLLKQVKFIWYETKDDNPKEVFTRLNIGKIALTNAELVKALLLSKTNFNQHINDDIYVKALQQEIAMQWDTIESDLQNREFWLFLNNIGDDRSTRIELIFYLIAKNDMLSCGHDEGSDDNKDAYYTFRYFYRFMAKAGSEKTSKSARIKTIWDQVMEIYLTLKEWYDDMELYHYIGFLIYCNNKPKYLYSLYKEWSKSTSKSEFRKQYLINEIKSCTKIKDLDNIIYDTKEGGPKHNCFSILLLHNVQTVINRNTVLLKNEKYTAGVFYKFPFHICKSEGWDIEHIDSNTTNSLNDIRTQREWLLNAYFGLTEEKDNNIRETIKIFFLKYPADQENVNKKERDEEFEELRKQIEGDEFDNSLRLTQEEKNKIWNFVLLDASTNRSYGNAIYPAKRRVIIGKEQGKKYASPTIDEEGEIKVKAEEGQSSFIPPCTKHVFMKYYDTTAFNPYSWTREDAKVYLEDIKKTLEPFLL